ncbi:hypothetical protein ACEPAG_7522 [Sanghuangporus baumii]
MSVASEVILPSGSEDVSENSAVVNSGFVAAVVAEVISSPAALVLVESTSDETVDVATSDKVTEVEAEAESSVEPELPPVAIVGCDAATVAGTELVTSLPSEERSDEFDESVVSEELEEELEVDVGLAAVLGIVGVATGSDWSSVLGAAAAAEVGVGVEAGVGETDSVDGAIAAELELGPEAKDDAVYQIQSKKKLRCVG